MLQRCEANKRFTDLEHTPSCSRLKELLQNGLFRIQNARIVAFRLSTGGWLSANTDAAYPYVDSATTYAAVWATFLVARKVLENWYYWLVIDAVSIFIYWSRDLQLTSMLFAVYVVMIPFGLFAWRRSWQEQQA